MGDRSLDSTILGHGIQWNRINLNKVVKNRKSFVDFISCQWSQIQKIIFDEQILDSSWDRNAYRLLIEL